MKHYSTIASLLIMSIWLWIALIIGSFGPSKETIQNMYIDRLERAYVNNADTIKELRKGFKDIYDSDMWQNNQ